ncbi:hypothetical protein BP5796_06248 [Coleophoma crateriformis]|uniref:CENP-V/GFA domain-containing protein n=1 Tax=Coleophoma crateriformis TaxID=565419 RepID=A0A3D8RWN7_9HELO|nr:hypothetical protein BP5796_06248 [Coleophoma crateriformis]
MEHRPLHGGCSCGRNKYSIYIPQGSTEVAKVIFDNGYAHRRSQATPLSAWLRIPLSWYQSSTYAFFDDETHNSIRRCYTSPTDQSSKRHFCGFCGTPLSYWSESPVSEAEYISLTLGSLAGSDLRDLEELGLLPKEALEDVESDKEKIEKGVPETSALQTTEGLPWFNTMIEGSKLGKMRTSKGQRRSSNGRVQVEWEIMEWTDEGNDDSHVTGKRKLGDLDDFDAALRPAGSIRP